MGCPYCFSVDIFRDQKQCSLRAKCLAERLVCLFIEDLRYAFTLADTCRHIYASELGEDLGMIIDQC